MEIIQLPLRPIQITFACSECGEAYVSKLSRDEELRCLMYEKPIPHCCPNDHEEGHFKVKLPGVLYAKEGELLSEEYIRNHIGPVSPIGDTLIEPTTVEPSKPKCKSPIIDRLMKNMEKKEDR